VAGLTKHQGQSTHNYRYDAYGQVLPAQGNWTDPHNHYTFLGKEWDEHLGLYEFGVRLYDPWAGVWLTREPLPGRAWGPRTWHRYQYAYASPISYYDPYGLAVTSWDGGGGPPLTPPRTPTSIPTPTGARCSPEPPFSHWWNERQRIADVFSKTALTLDAIALLLSGIEAAVTDVSAVALITGFAVAGASAEGVGMLPGAWLGLKIALALDVAIAGSSLLAGAENVLGIAALAATAVSDLFAGYSGLTEEGFAIGQDTLVSARNMVLGFIPESNIDFAISASQFHYDIGRNFTGRPGGLVVFTSPTDWEAWRRLLGVLLKEW